ncbi:MAG: hypothetical protein NZT61_04850 [Deltaproteobacteria bacterium]|nr:hypothetical protein [Deltaproteobacteria bacterium]
MKQFLQRTISKALLAELESVIGTKNTRGALDEGTTVILHR